MASERDEAKNVLLVVGGGIAAYKSCELTRALQKLGCEVRVCMTQDALRFVGTTTFEALTGHHVLTDLYDGSSRDPIAHITLSGWADVVVVAPATANLMAKLAAGIADDAATSTLVACDCPVVVAPAMNSRMWANQATVANVTTLRGRGVSVVEPGRGRLACGETGTGKLAEVDEIARAVLGATGASGEGTLAGRRVLVNAGPTREAIDPVRYISNSSSGKMGIAIARAALERGADVTLVLGPVEVPAPAGADIVRVTSAAEMLEACERAFAAADAAILSAAVADYTPARPATQKLKKGRDALDRIDLVETEDILARLSAQKGDRVVVGFAAETENLLENARAKLERKGCDFLVANDVSRADSTFGADTDDATFVTREGAEPQGLLTKDELAGRIVDRVATLVAAKR